MTEKDVKDDKISTHFLVFIGREAYSVSITLAYLEKPISLPYANLKKPQLNRVMNTTFEYRERTKFHKMIRRNNQKVRKSILELQRHAPNCSFGDQLYVQLRYQLVPGINIPDLERELLRIPNCSFEDARTVCINCTAVKELDIQSAKIYNALLTLYDEIQSQGRSN
ncbi:unnamed protein product [Schistosoma mattheei]|uniref:Uncharacterized protein n=1 Tax=Schistosoma mattheei TaxID=31246 RepID=A0A183NLN0_9TREM|nr:unnamed protein product [Schistosoma mattheei]